MSLTPMFLSMFNEIYHLDMLACQDDKFHTTIDMFSTFILFLGLFN